MQFRRSVLREFLDDLMGKYRLLLLASAVVSLLSGCGADSGSGPTDNGPIEPPSPTGGYRMVELPGGPVAHALDINDQGQIVGQADGVGGESCSPDTSTPCPHAVLWTVNEEGQVIDAKDLGTFDGVQISSANGINNLGQVVGWSWFAEVVRPFVWTADSGMPGSPLAVIVPGFLHGAAHAINDNGQVVGVALGQECGRRVLVWTVAPDGTVTDTQDFGTLGAVGERVCTRAINRLGHFVGIIPSFIGSSGFFWADDSVVVIPDASAVLGINDEDELVGRTRLDEPFLWRAETGVQLLADGGLAWDINNRGQVVGSSDGKPVIWQDGEMQVLPAPALDYSARAINEKGMIVGSGVQGGPSKAVLWVLN